MCRKLIITVLALSLCLISSVGAVTVNWDFENGNDHNFSLWCVSPATFVFEDPNIAGEEALTGAGGPAGLPDAGVAWTVGPPDQFDGLIPPVVEGCHVVNDLLQYGPCNDPFGYTGGTPNSRGQTGYLNTYNLSQWGDNLHTQENDQIATSPVVILGENSVLTVWSHGGGSGTHAPEYDPDPTLMYTDGSSGIAVLSAEADDMYAILAAVHTNGKSTLIEDTLDLSAFAGRKVQIDVVDAFEGGWGWLAIDEIEITNATSRRAAFVVANADLTGGFDQAQHDRLESLGYSIKVVEPGEIGSTFTVDDCNAYDLLLISESIFSSDGDPLIGTTTPVMTQEGNIWDNWLQMGRSVAADWRDHSEVDIVNDTHPIVVDANVSMGPMQFYTAMNSCVTDLSSNLAPGAELIAEMIPAGESDAYAIVFAIDKGAELADGTPATARSVGFALPGQASMDPEVMTDEAWALWDASIAWLDPPPPVITVGPIDTMVATGNQGTILSINGIDVNDMVLGTSMFPNAPWNSSYPAENADNLSLNSLSSSDNQPYMQTMFDQAVTTIFIVELRGDDSGYVQALDAMGDPIESMVEFSPDDFKATGYKGAIADAYALVIRSEIPIYGIQLIANRSVADGGLGIDPFCIAAVPSP